ncbi:SDR family NAD(P)-dependent oxidoreductase [Modestobacter roseus]|uniref:SDR family NAD(P)-dependent oxidoreductase n=1 Tax=Modestobacter roseus TaxID=1181884 RepID=UPI001413031F
MGAGGRRVPRLRRVPDPHRPGDPGVRRRARTLSGAPDERPVAVVTGASDGIGAAAARRLHRAGWRVVAVGRSPEKTAAIGAEVGVETAVADFARLEDVRRLAADLTARLPRIDVLAGNAGATFGRPGRTVDGIEQTFQVDHLAPYLLTRLLEEPLRAGGGRVVTTSSGAHWLGGVRRGRLAGLAEVPRPYAGMLVYSRAKWANVLFTRELARRWAPDVTATSFEPGAVATSFAQASRGVAGLVFRSPLRAFMRTPAQGADTLVWLATAEEGWRDGGHHSDRSPARTLPSAADDVRARELWDLSARLVGLPA